MKIVERIAINTLFIYSAKFIEGILQFAVLGYILKVLDKESYGIALLFISIQASIEILRLGLGKAAIKYMSEYLAQNNLQKAQHILSTSFFFQGLVGGGGLLICLCMIPFATTLLNIPSDVQHASTISLVIVGVSILFNSIMTPWQFALLSYERYDLNSISLLCGKLLRALIIFISLSVKPSFLCIVVATSIGVLCERVINLIFLKYLKSEFFFQLKVTSKKYASKVLTFSFFELFHTVSNILYRHGTLFIAAHLISLNAVGDLGILFTIAQFVRVIVMQFATMFVPIASRLNAIGEKKEIIFLVRKSATLCCVLGGGILTGLIPWIGPILSLWIGAEYIYLAGYTILLLVSEFLFCSIGSLHSTLGGIGKIKLDGINNLASMVFGLICGCCLIVLFDLGMLGLIWGLFLSRLLRFCFVTVYTSKMFDFAYFRFLFDCYAKPFCLIGLVIMAAKTVNLEIVQWYTVVPASIATASVFLLLCAGFLFKQDLKIIMKEKINNYR
ncbi:MAG: oligosaccharide flippase family protein [Desulfobacter sp.]